MPKQHLCVQNPGKLLTVEECGDGTGQACVFPWTLAGIAMAVASHASELVIVKVRPRWAVRVACHAAQQCVWIQHKSLLTLGALVCLRARAATAGLVALCNADQ